MESKTFGIIIDTICRNLSHPLEFLNPIQGSCRWILKRVVLLELFLPNPLVQMALLLHLPLLLNLYVSFLSFFFLLGCHIAGFLRDFFCSDNEGKSYNQLFVYFYFNRIIEYLNLATG